MNDQQFAEGGAGAVGNEVRGWVGGPVVQAGVIHGDVHLRGTSQGPGMPYPWSTAKLTSNDLITPRQLPVHTPHFVGRTEELHQLTKLLDTVAEGGPVVISAINGTAGIGKTALAVHWAHQVADRFPDGQLYVNLRGFDPTGMPVKPAEAIRGFLDAFEIPPEQIPIDLDAQAALYRRLLVNRKVLVVLDNARDIDQARPLLPGSSACRVVITSRNQLAGLIAHEGAHPINLDVLSTEEATTLLAHRLGEDRVTAEHDVVAELINHCARLPLALAIVAARAALNPRLPLRVLAEEIRDEQSRLDVLDAGDPATSVRAVFSWSYQHLNAPAARLFRLLGVHPGPDISLAAAASLAGIEARYARATLDELARTHLVTQHSPRRFAFHDLLRAYASELAEMVDTESMRCGAVHRMLDHYLHTAHTAAMTVHPRVDPIALAAPHPGAALEEPANYEAAWTWFDAEYPVLLTITQLAVTTGWDTHAWQLPWTLAEFFERRGHWHDWAAIQQVALTAACRQGDLRGQAHAHRSLGRACPWLGRHEEAHTHFQEALRLFKELGDQANQAHTHIDIGWIHGHQNRHKEAVAHALQALALARAGGSRVGQGRALNNAGWYYAQLGEPQRALSYCQQSITLHRETGDHRGEAHALDSLGYAHYHLGHHREAIALYHQSISLNREIGSRYDEAIVLAHLGNAHHATGDIAAARGAWQRSLTVLDHLGIDLGASLGYPDADEVRTKLAELDWMRGT